MDSSVQQKVTALNAGWYNEVSQAMSLDMTTFQLAQGTLGLQTSDSSGLFLMSDAVPPSASVAYYDPSGLSRRSQAYAALLTALQPEIVSSLADVLGDQYASWITYRVKWASDPTNTDTQAQAFAKWADKNLDPGIIEQAKTAYAQADAAPLNKALAALKAPDGQQGFVDTAKQPYTLYKYTATVEAAQNAIAGGGHATIKFDSSSMDSKLSHTTAEGSASGFYDIFSGGVGGSFDKLNTQAATSELSIVGEINSFATLVTAPGSWFNSSEFTRAFNAHNDFTVWNQHANLGDWDSFFGQPDGSLARRVTQLVLVSDYSIAVTSNATYSSEDYMQIKANANFEIWPFFSASASATHTTDVKHEADGSLTVVHTLDKGKIQIWGATVQQAPA